jgi:hypothetical protein
VVLDSQRESIADGSLLLNVLASWRGWRSAS